MGPPAVRCERERFGRGHVDARGRGGDDARGRWRLRRAPREWAASVGLGLLLAGLGGAATLLVPAGAQAAVAILVATSGAIALSLLPAVRRLRPSYALGDYCLLVFCLAFGTLADLRRLAAAGGLVVLWTAIVLVLGVALHVLLCRLLGVDRDTAVVTSTAAIFSPAFVPPVVANLANRELLISGIGAALLGLALGNYLGLLVAHAVRLAVGG